MQPLRDDQYISLSPTDSPADDAEIDSGAAALGPAQVECQGGLTRLAADTPRTPGPRSVDFQQFVIDYELTFEVTLMAEEASIQVPGLSLGTLVPNSVQLHHSHNH